MFVTLVSLMALQVGEVIGDYRVLGVLGVGGMGTVYKVQHEISNRVEALKVLLPDLAGAPELADRFAREIRVHASLNHPNIAAMHNALRVGNHLVMVMEFVDGISLHTRLKRGAMPVWDAVDILHQVLGALSYAHGKGIIHRDVKPANIMLTLDGSVKLMDFGIARSATAEQLTQSGMAVGSIHYMAPEQVRGQPADARTDLYSVGVTLYEATSGTRPFGGDSSFDVMNAHINVMPQSPTELNADIPQDLAKVILCALEKKPEDRFQTAAEFGASLETARSAHGWQHRSQLTGGETIVAQSQLRMAPEVSAPTTPTPSGGRTARTTPPSGTAATGPITFDEARLDSIKRELSKHLGPMARVVVERAARKATSWKQLYETLGAELPEGPERERFLASRPRSG